MNVKKKVLGALFLLFLLSSCSLINSVFGILPNNDMGALLTVDSDGHFKEDIEYDFGTWKEVYQTDGSYSEYSYSYSATTGEVILSETYEGTYSWDPDTYIVDYYFDTYTDEETVTTYVQEYDGELTTYFTNSNRGRAYVLTSDGGNTWESSRLYTYSDGSESSYTYTYTIASSTISYSYVGESRDSSGTLSSGTKNEIEYDIIGTYPEGSEWKSGNSVTFTVEETVKREATVTSGVYGDWTDYTLERTTLSLGNTGDFMFFNSAASTKSLDQGK